MKLTHQQQIKVLIAEIFNISSKLTNLSGRPFTPDGHMVGSIGEIYAKEFYGIELYPPSHHIHDGHWNKREVQIKATQRDSVDLKGETELLLVFKIKEDGTFEEVYNGDGKKPWASLSHRKITKDGEISISLNQLRKLNMDVDIKDKIPRIKF